MSTMGYVSTLAGAADAASLNLDFKNQRYKVAGVSKTFSDLVTFTRASGGGRFNSSGQYEWLANDQPRFDYDPVTKVLRGLLIEGVSTNLHNYSEDFVNAAWNKGVCTISKTPGVTTPIGVSHKFSESTVAGPHFLQRSFTAAAGSSYTATRIIKAGERTEVRGQLLQGSTAYASTAFNLATGTILGGGSGTSSIQALGDGWYLCTITAVMPAAVSTADRWYPADGGGATSYTGDGVSGYYVAGAQLEQGSFGTSYIPTPTSFVSRASTGTYFDSKGVLQTAAENVARYDYNPLTLQPNGLLVEDAATNRCLYSGDIGNAAWTVIAATKSPSGDTWNGMNGYTITGSGVNYSRVRNGFGAAPINANEVVTFYYKGGTSGKVRITCRNESALSESNVTGNIGSPLTVISTAAGGVTIIQDKELDHGVRVVSVLFTPTTPASAHSFHIGPNSVVDGETVIAFGSQLEAGTKASSYIPVTPVFTSRTTSGTYFDSTGTMQLAAPQVARIDYNPVTKVSKGLLVENARTNSLTYTDNIQAVLWTNTASSLKPNTMLAPDGTLTGTKLIEDTTTAIHYVDKLSGSGTVSVGTTYTVSAYVKAGERTRARLVGVISTAAPTTSDAFFDLTTGTVVSTGSTGASDSRIEAVGNGWYRISVAFTVQSNSAAMTPRAYYQLVNGGTTFSYAGDGVSGFYIWGPQLEIGTFPTSYIPSPSVFTGRASTATWLDSNGFMQTAAINAARTNAYLYDDTNTLKPVGLLIERNPATNLAKFSNEWTNAAWTKATGVAISTDGTLAPDGTVAQKFTLSGATGHEVWSSLTTPLTAGTTYTLSVWLKPIGAVVPSFQLAYYDGGTIVPGAGGGANNQVVGQWKRYSFTFTPSTTPTTPRIRLIGFSGGLDGNSFYMFNCQLEAGNYATSDIFSGASEVTRAAEFSSSAATTRAADVVSTPTATRAADITSSTTLARAGDFATVNTLTPWFNAAEGTIMSEFQVPNDLNTGTFRRPVALSGSPTGEISHYLNGTTGGVAGFIHNGTAEQMNLAVSSPVYVKNEIRRAATAYKVNDSNFATKGVATTTDTTVALPTVAYLGVGGMSTGNRWNGYVRSVNYYPRRLTNAELTMISL